MVLGPILAYDQGLRPPATLCAEDRNIRQQRTQGIQIDIKIDTEIEIQVEIENRPKSNLMGPQNYKNTEQKKVHFRSQNLRINFW